MILNRGENVPQENNPKNFSFKTKWLKCAPYPLILLQIMKIILKLRNQSILVIQSSISEHFFRLKLPRLRDWKKCEVLTSLQLLYLGYFYLWAITHCWELSYTIEKIKTIIIILIIEESECKLKFLTNNGLALLVLNGVQATDFLKESRLVWDTLAQPVVFSRFRPWYFVWT